MRFSLKAFFLSFLVYAMPVVYGHGGSLVGLILWTELTNGGGRREPLWLAMDVGLALALQLAGFLAFAWILGGRRRWLALFVLAPGLLWIFHLVYLVEIPKRFLIEAQTASETGEWPLVCSVRDASTTGLRAGITLALERAGEIWIRTGQDARYGVLSMPGCKVRSRKLFFPGARGGIGFVAPGGAVYYRLDQTGDGAFEHLFQQPGAMAPLKLRTPPETDYWVPVFSADSSEIAWIETQRDENRRILGHRIVTRRLANGREERIELEIEPYTNPHLLDYDKMNGEFLVTSRSREILRIGAGGVARGEPVRPPGFESIGENIRVTAGGWVAWDGYREGERYRLAWSVPGGGGRIEIPKGRRITAVSVDPGGRYVAVSISRNLSIGDVRDAVFVVRVADGAEIYRRYLDTYTRSQIGFLGRDYLAVSIIKDGKARIDVLRVPDA